LTTGICLSSILNMRFIFTSNFLHFHSFVRFLLLGLLHSLADGYIRSDLLMCLSPSLADLCASQDIVTIFVGSVVSPLSLSALKHLPLLNLKEVVVEAPAAKLSSTRVIAVVLTVMCHQEVPVFGPEVAP
jgi:hypothetical protein